MFPFRVLPLALALSLGAGISVSQAQTLRWANQGDPQTMDPHSQNEVLTNAVNNHVYEALVGRGDNLELVPELAERWQQTGPLTWRMWLRKGVKFHDGAPFTADDVVFSVERASMPTSQMNQYAAAMGKPVKIDDHMVEFRLERPNPVFLEHASSFHIMNRAWATKNKAEKPLDYKNREETFAARNANGTGPFMLRSREPDIRTVLTRNPAYTGARKTVGNVQEVVFTPIKSDQTRVAALLSDGVNFVQDPAPQDVLRLQQNPAIKVVQGMENRVIFLGMDQQRDELINSSVKGKNPFKDKRVRQAIYQAIDTDTLVRNTMRNQAVVTGCITPSPLGCFADLEPRAYRFDLEAARKLLADAGYPGGFEVGMDCPNNRYVNDEEICIAVTGMLAKIGIKVNLATLPRANYFPKLEKHDTSFYMLGWGGAITDPQTTLDPVLHSPPTPSSKKGLYNYGRYTNPRMDQAINAAATETDPEKRKQFVRQALSEHREQVHHIPLHRQFIPWAARSNVDLKHYADNTVRAWTMTVR
jgi:peptide/nickel transport system substrate-binding protein